MLRASEYQEWQIYIRKIMLQVLINYIPFLFLMNWSNLLLVDMTKREQI